MSTNRIGIVTHLYLDEDGKSKDFKNTYVKILNYLDRELCDTVIFSLYTLHISEIDNFEKFISKLKNIKKIFIDSFIENEKNINFFEHITFVIDERVNKITNKQMFTSSDSIDKDDVIKFRENFKESRVIDDCALLICGEINLFTTNQDNYSVEDKYEIIPLIERNVKIVINQGHDEMGRPHYVKAKRKFLSKNGRYLISVWNKGKKPIDFDPENSKKYWEIYHDGTEIHANIANPFNHQRQYEDINICIIDIKSDSIPVVRKSNKL